MMMALISCIIWFMLLSSIQAQETGGCPPGTRCGVVCHPETGACFGQNHP
jgi:hypothetical protein